MLCSLTAPSHYLNQYWPSKVFCSSHLRSISQEVLMNLIHNLCSETTLSKFLPHLQGANKLTSNYKEQTYKHQPAACIWWYQAIYRHSNDLIWVLIYCTSSTRVKSSYTIMANCLLIMRGLFWCLFHELHAMRETRTTRMPAFWGYPRRLMITHTIESYWIPSQKKTKSKLQI